MRPAICFAGLFAVLLVCCELFPSRGLGQELPVPDEADLERAREMVKDIFGKPYAEAKSGEQKQALVKTMLDAVADTKNPAERYALLQVARQIAVAAGDGAASLRVVDQIDASFQIDAVRMKAGVLHELSRSAELRLQHKAVAQQCLEVADEALRADDAEVASKLAEMALAASRKAFDSELSRRIVAWKRDFDEVVQACEKAKRGRETLETDPTDATANLDVGRYSCFVKGDWKNGLLMLALGDDLQLREIAVQEVGPPLEAGQRAKVGDAWWELAEQTEDFAKTAMYARAAYHYRLAAPQFKGLVGVKIKKRLTELAEENAGALRAADQMARLPRPTVRPPKPAEPQPPPSVPQPSRPPLPPSVSELPQPMPPRETPAVSRVVTIPANSARGFVIGPVPKGTKITLQYVSGKWKAWGSQADICPDKTGGRGGATCLLAIVAFDAEEKTSQLLEVVSQGTKTTPFSYEVPENVPLLALRIKGRDNKWSGNPGKVQYNLAITPPPGASAAQQLAPRGNPAEDVPVRPQPGLAGRVTVGGQDAGLILWYSPGKALRDKNLGAMLSQLGIAGGKTRVDLRGVITVARPTNVTVRHKGGSSSGGVLRLYVNGKELSAVGDDRSKDKKQQIDLAAGQHEVRWVLSGGKIGGHNLIQFTDTNTGVPIPVVCAPAIVAQLQAMPYKASVRIDSD